MKSGAITAFVFASLLSASVMAAPHPILEEEHQAGAMVARQGRCTIAFWDYWRNPNNCKLIYPGYPGQGTMSLARKCHWGVRSERFASGVDLQSPAARQRKEIEVR
ncbi:unnamed protein product [Tilletia controversa]|nr:unnamed protein product [Tilletia controversa]